MGKNGNDLTPGGRNLHNPMQAQRSLGIEDSHPPHTIARGCLICKENSLIPSLNQTQLSHCGLLKITSETSKKIKPELQNKFA